MKQTSSRRSIDTKLIMLTFGSMLLILMLASSAFFVQQYQASTQQSKERLQTIAALLSKQAAATLLFADPRSAEEDLSALRTQPSVISAIVCDAHNNLFARYNRDPDSETPSCIRPSGIEPATLIESIWPRSDIRTIHPIIVDGEQIGHIDLLDDNTQGKALLLNHALISTGIVAFAVFLATLFAVRLPGLITKPIKALARTAERIAKDGDYSQRAEKTHDDEIGSLVDGFNSMLDELEERETALNHYGKNLELLVEQRTQALEAAILRAEEANDAKSRFLAKISHEIRTPMTAILGLSELLAQTPLTRTQADYLKSQGHSAEMLLCLIDDLLEFSQYEAGKIRLKPIACQLPEIGKELEGQFRDKARQKKLDYSIIGFESIRDTVVADRTKLTQILFNLTGNAIKFTHQGHVCVRATVIKDSTDALEVVFSVQDSDIGIAEEKQKSIFAPFDQVLEPASPGAQDGVGLGLAICQELVELMGGTIEVNSTPRRGSEFVVTLRLDKHETTAVHYLEPREDTAKPKILLVEDDLVIQELHGRFLTTLGYPYDVATTVTQATELLKEKNYDLILLDIQLPDTDGVELTTELRAQAKFKVLPIIGLTAQALETQIQSALSGGMDEVLSKPITMAKLANAIKRWTSDDARPQVTQPSQPNTNGGVHKRLESYRKQVGNEGTEVLCSRLLDSLPETVNKLVAAAERKDQRGLSNALHQLEGSLAFWADVETENLLGKLRNNMTQDNATQPLLEKLEANMEQVLKAIAVYLGEITNQPSDKVIKLSARDR